MTQRTTESLVMHASLETLYHIILDFENYGEWVSELKRAEVLARDALGRAIEVEFRAAAFGRSTTYTLHYDYRQAPERVAWRQSEGDLTETMDGEYRFEALEDGTLVTYDLEVELRVPLPSFVKARAASRIQTQALAELKARAER